MSRNFELMQELEKGVHSSPITEPVFALSDGKGRWPTDRPLADDLSLNLVQRVFMLQTKEPPRIVVFAGIDHGNGCSQIASSVAQTLAQNVDVAVCLVEGNLRSPALPRMLGTTNHYGLAESLLEDRPIRSFAKPVSNGKLWLLSSGSLAADSPNLLTSERMKARCEELREEFSFVIIDAPPLSQYADAMALGRLSDGLVLVIEAESTRRDTAYAITEGLRSAGIRILGAVLNKRSYPIPQAIYSKL
jgi:Mrp family chromosome partitioning ATPase